MLDPLSHNNTFVDKAVLAPQDLHSALPVAVNSDIPLGEMRYRAKMGPTIITTAIAVLLGSIKMDSCLYFNYTGKNQPIAQNINSSLSIYRNSTACCNCASPNIFHSTNVPLALPSEIFMCGDCSWGGTPGSIHESIQKGREGVDKLRQDGERGWINNFLGGFGLGRWAMHLLKLLTVSLLIFLCILIHVPENDRPLYLGNIKKHTRLIKFRFVLHIGVRTSQSATTAPCPGSLEPTGAGESMPGLAGGRGPTVWSKPLPLQYFWGEHHASGLPAPAYSSSAGLWGSGASSWTPCSSRVAPASRRLSMPSLCSFTVFFFFFPLFFLLGFSPKLAKSPFLPVHFSARQPGERSKALRENRVSPHPHQATPLCPIRARHPWEQPRLTRILPF